MGVGKTTVCQLLKNELPNCVFLDGDWCWDANPFQVTAETKAMVLDNIGHLLNNFLHCSAYESVIFCWVLHEQTIIDDILTRLDFSDSRLYPISLICDESTLESRLRLDIQSGIRTPDVLPRSLARLPHFNSVNTIKVDTTGKDVPTVAREILSLT